MNLKSINWEKDYNLFIDYLFSIRDIKYKEFNSKIINTKYEILGVRSPILKKIAKEIFKGDYEAFLNIQDYKYYEIIMLKGLVLGFIKDINKLENYFYSYLYLIDNWALCDSFCANLKIVNTNKEYFKGIIDNLINTGHEYKVRVGLVLLLDFYVEKEYLEYLYFIISKNNDLYYVNMARSWLLCECFIKYQKETLEYLDNNNLDKFTINKAISKIRDSFRVSKDVKEYILKYKR